MAWKQSQWAWGTTRLQVIWMAYMSSNWNVHIWWSDLWLGPLVQKSFILHHRFDFMLYLGHWHTRLIFTMLVGLWGDEWGGYVMNVSVVCHWLISKVRFSGGGGGWTKICQVYCVKKVWCGRETLLYWKWLSNVSLGLNIFCDVLLGWVSKSNIWNFAKNGFHNWLLCTCCAKAL